MPETKEFSTFCQKSWANPVGKIQVYNYVQIIFVVLKFSFFFRILSNFIVRNFLPKKQRRENLRNSAPKSWVNPFRKLKFCTMFKKAFFYQSRRAIFVIMLTNNIFSGKLCQNITGKFSFQIFEKSLAIPFENIGNFFLLFLT